MVEYLLTIGHKGASYHFKRTRNHTRRISRAAFEKAVNGGDHYSVKYTLGDDMKQRFTYYKPTTVGVAPVNPLIFYRQNLDTEGNLHYAVNTIMRSIRTAGSSDLPVSFVKYHPVQHMHKQVILPVPLKHTRMQIWYNHNKPTVTDSLQNVPTYYTSYDSEGKEGHQCYGSNCRYILSTYDHTVFGDKSYWNHTIRLFLKLSKTSIIPEITKYGEVGEKYYYMSPKLDGVLNRDHIDIDKYPHIEKKLTDLLHRAHKSNIVFDGHLKIHNIGYTGVINSHNCVLYVIDPIVCQIIDNVKTDFDGYFTGRMADINWLSNLYLDDPPKDDEMDEAKIADRGEMYQNFFDKNFHHFKK